MNKFMGAFTLTLGFLICVTLVYGDVLPGDDGPPPPRCLAFLTCDIDCYGPATLVITPGNPFPIFSYSCLAVIDQPLNLRDCIPFKDVNADGVNDCKCTCKFIKFVVAGEPLNYCMCQL